MNIRDKFLAVDHFVESTLLAFNLQAIPAFAYFPYAFILSYLSHLSRLSLPTAEIPHILYSFVANMNIFFAAAARSVFLQCCIFVFLFPFTTLQTTHTIGVLDFVQEEVGSLCKSKSCSPLIKDILIFIRHVTLLNNAFPHGQHPYRTKPLETTYDAIARGQIGFISVGSLQNIYYFTQTPLETTYDAIARGQIRSIV